jgi:hypothetical protein
MTAQSWLFDESFFSCCLPRVPEHPLLATASSWTTIAIGWFRQFLLPSATRIKVAIPRTFMAETCDVIIRFTSWKVPHISKGTSGAHVITLFTTYSFAVGFRFGAFYEVPYENCSFLRCLMSNHQYVSTFQLRVLLPVVLDVYHAYVFVMTAQPWMSDEALFLVLLTACTRTPLTCHRVTMDTHCEWLISAVSPISHTHLACIYC